MNSFQKAGVLVVRIVAALLILVGSLWLIGDLILLALPQRTFSARGTILVSEIPVARLVSESVTCGLGLFLWLFSIPLGRLLGKRLD